MTESAPSYTASTPEVAWDRPVPTPRAFTDTVTVEAILDAAFRVAGYRICACGATVEPPAAVCHACLTGNRRLGPLYGGSLAGHAATAGLQPDGAELEAWVTLLCAENRALRGQLADAQAAAVRAGKGGEGA